MPAGGAHLQWQVAKTNSPLRRKVPSVKVVNCSYKPIQSWFLLCYTHSPFGFEAPDPASLVDSLSLVVMLLFYSVTLTLVDFYKCSLITH